MYIKEVTASLLCPSHSAPKEKPWLEKEPRQSSPVRPVVLPPNLHLLSLSVPGWNYSSNHNVHLSHINSGEKREENLTTFKTLAAHIEI